MLAATDTKLTDVLFHFQMSLKDGSGPEGEVYSTYSDISGIRFGIVIAAAFEPSYSYSLDVKYSGLGENVRKITI